MALTLVEIAAITGAAVGLPLAWPSPLAGGASLPYARWLAVAAACLLAFHYADLCEYRALRSFPRFLSTLPRALGLAVMLAAGVQFALPALRMPAAWTAAALAGCAALLVAIRAVAYPLMAVRAKRVLLVGDSPLAWRLIEEIGARPRQGWSVIGVVDDDDAGGRRPGARRLLGPLEQLGRIIHDQRPDRILVTLASRRGRLPVQTLLKVRVRGVPIEDGSDAYERLAGKVAIESLRPSGLIFCRDFHKSRAQLAFNRALSLLFAATALLLLLPAFALIALLIALDSPGPLLFVQHRIGQSGRRFRLLKFRTMVPSRRRASEWVKDNAERITRVGRLLRRYRLDELPQFWNVLRGDMNLVGPRPHPVCNHALFARKIPYYSLRCTVRPGITGWAQVLYGYANSLEEETEKMRYDLYYIKHMSLWLDLRILLGTVKMVLLGRGASSVTRDARVVPIESGRRPALWAGEAQMTGRVGAGREAQSA